MLGAEGLVGGGAARADDGHGHEELPARGGVRVAGRRDLRQTGFLFGWGLGGGVALVKDWIGRMGATTNQHASIPQGGGGRGERTRRCRSWCS